MTDQPTVADILTQAARELRPQFTAALQDLALSHANYAEYAPRSAVGAALALAKGCAQAHDALTRHAEPDDAVRDIIAAGPNAWISALNVAGKLLQLPRDVIQGAASRPLPDEAWPA
jgi:hypothetical protein